MNIESKLKQIQNKLKTFGYPEDFLVFNYENSTTKNNKYSRKVSSVNFEKMNQSIYSFLMGKTIKRGVDLLKQKNFIQFYKETKDMIIFLKKNKNSSSIYKFIYIFFYFFPFRRKLIDIIQKNIIILEKNNFISKYGNFHNNFFEDSTINFIHPFSMLRLKKYCQRISYNIFLLINIRENKSIKKKITYTNNGKKETINYITTEERGIFNNLLKNETFIIYSIIINIYI